jgi:hypothetical protein
MSIFDSLEEYTISPVKVGANLFSDIMKRQDIPSWDEIVGAFKKEDDTHLPEVEFTTNHRATELTDRIIEHGNVTIARSDDLFPWPAHKPFTLSQPAG